MVLPSLMGIKWAGNELPIRKVLIDHMGQMWRTPTTGATVSCLVFGGGQIRVSFTTFAFLYIHSCFFIPLHVSIAFLASTFVFVASVFTHFSYSFASIPPFDPFTFCHILLFTITFLCLPLPSFAFYHIPSFWPCLFRINS